MWIKRHEPKAYAAARTLLMPKDYINFRLTGARAIDFPEASCNYLLDIRTGTWSEEIVDLAGLDLKMLPPLKNASEVLGNGQPGGCTRDRVAGRNAGRRRGRGLSGYFARFRSRLSQEWDPMSPAPPR